MLTKKDYLLILGVLAKERRAYETLGMQSVIDSAVAELAKNFGDANPRFDRAVFMSTWAEMGGNAWA